MVTREHGVPTAGLLMPTSPSRLHRTKVSLHRHIWTRCQRVSYITTTCAESLLQCVSADYVKRISTYPLITALFHNHLGKPVLKIPVLYDENYNKTNMTKFLKFINLYCYITLHFLTWPK